MSEKTTTIAELKQDGKNFNKGTESGQRLIEKSFREFGAGRSVLVDKDNNIIAGNKSALAAETAGIKRVRIIETDGSELIAVKRTDISLDSREGRELALADNATASVNLSWDAEQIAACGVDVAGWGVEIDTAGVEVADAGAAFFEREDRNDDSREEGNDEYNEFLEKFEPKKTTDDCYTPEPVYEAVVGWVEKEYHVSRANFVRPFYPGGDYKTYKYSPESVVVDNPPFSIMSEIIQHYVERDIKFFLFAPALTLFSSSSSLCASLCVGVGVTYENKATVSTSFVTNLEPKDIRIRTAPELYKLLEAANDKYCETLRASLPKYTYPDNVITAAFVARMSKYGQDLRITANECERVSILDDMREKGAPGIFGSGYLISSAAAAERAAAERAAAERAAAERAAAERAAATKWQLSERELAIIAKLDKQTL